MEKLEDLRKLVGPEADGWNRARLEQLDRDMETMAALLLDLYRLRKQSRSLADASSSFDTLDSDG